MADLSDESFHERHDHVCPEPKHSFVFWSRLAGSVGRCGAGWVCAAFYSLRILVMGFCRVSFYPEPESRKLVNTLLRTICVNKK